MNNNVTDPNIQRLIRELKITRIACIIVSVLTLCLLAGGVFLFGRVQRMAEICEPVVEKISALDVESLNRTMDNVNASLEGVDWEQVAAALEKLDVDALNAAIEGLDTAELTQSLKNLNEAVEKIRELSEKLSSLSSLFSVFH